MTETTNFREVAEEFDQRVRGIVWCAAVTVDTKGRPRSRLLHPIWETGGQEPVGWIATGRQSLKAKHLERTPYISLTYWTPEHKQAMVECRADWRDDAAEKQRVWDLYQSTPQPYGYDPAAFWPSGPADPGFGVLRLRPWRLELWTLQDLMAQQPPRVWRPAQ